MTFFGARKILYLLALSLILFGSATADDETPATITVGSSRIDVLFDPGKLQTTQQDLLHWIQNAANAVAAYYGRFPVPHLRLRIIPGNGSGVRGGQTFGMDGGFIRIRVGSETTVADLSYDWELTHEMVHLAFPSMADEHHWIEEGLSTYVEPIARIQTGQWKAEQMWSDLVRDMPKGQPREGDQGLDHTHTWGRTYWGGALFCFVADVEIRKKTRNRKGLQDALRGILNAGGDIRQDWDLEKALKTGDEAVGVSVLVPLYHQWKDQPVNADLTVLWNQLGIAVSNGKVQLRDDAPLASIRRAITEAKPN